MNNDFRPGEDTDIIPGLRPSDTSPLPLEAPPVRGRHRRGMSRLMLVAVWGAPVAVVALLVGYSLPGLFGVGGLRPAPPAVASSPSTRDTAEMEVGEPTPPRPSESHADRSRPHQTTPSPSRTSRTPTPTPSPTSLPSSPVPSPRPSPSSASPSPSPSDSDTATPTPTLTILPEATDGP